MDFGIGALAISHCLRQRRYFLYTYVIANEDGIVLFLFFDDKSEELQK